MKEYERILQECLDALADGRWDVEECVRHYPRYADELRAHLAVVSDLQHAYDAQPSDEFASASRERFLIATGQRLTEAYDVDPSLSFFAAARVKFLMTAHRMGLRERARTPRFPLFGVPFRALAATATALVLFLSFSTYTVASASNALPGDWQYGVKLQTERVRLALAFSDSAERDVRMDMASERAEEIQQLAAKGRIIPPGVIDRLANETQPLVDAASDGKLSRSETARLNAVTARQRNVLAQVEDQVAPDAAGALAEAKTLSDEGYEVTFVQIVNDPGSELPRVITPVDPIETEAPEPTDTPEPTSTPVETATPGDPPTSTATAEPPDGTPQVDPEPVDTVFGVIWVRLSAGSGFSTLIPSEKDGWRISGANSALVQLSNVDGTSLVTINPRNGDTYWFILRDGRFDQVHMRLTKDGQTLIIDRAALRAAYGAAAEIPIYIMNHIELVPAPAE